MSVSLRELLRSHCTNTLEESLLRPLDFKIPTTSLSHLRDYPGIFQQANSEIVNTLPYFLSGNSSIGDGSFETSTAVSDGAWISLINLCCPGVCVYYNQKDQSSMVRLRPDVALYMNGALFLKGEQKAKQQDLEIAEVELVDKLHSSALNVFPMGSRSILGFTSTLKIVTIFHISHQDDSFTTHTPLNFEMSHERGRVEFLVFLMKFLRFVVTIERPNQRFHLVPNIRKRTLNGHHVTWVREGILKEYRTLRSDQQMQWIGEVYQLSLLHVEHGYIVADRTSIATRVGRTLSACITDGTVTIDVAFTHIRLGVDELHRNGFAHCDICVDNCLVDVSGPTPLVFLDDLEYIRPIDYPPPPPPHNSRLPPGTALPSTAQELDKLQLQSLKNQIVHI